MKAADGFQLKAADLRHCHAAFAHLKGFSLYLNGARIIYNDGREQTEICDISELHLLGSHNHENVMAAIVFTQSSNSTCLS